MNRRNLILAAPFALAGCNVPDATVAQVSSDVSAIASSLQQVLGQIGSVSGVSAATVSTVGTAVADIQALATAISGAASVAVQKPLVQRLEGYVGAVVAALVPLSAVLPPPIPQVVMAVSILLPIVEAAVGMILPAQATAARPAMSSDQARVLLRSYGAKR